MIKIKTIENKIFTFLTPRDDCCPNPTKMFNLVSLQSNKNIINGCELRSKGRAFRKNTQQNIRTKIGAGIRPISKAQSQRVLDLSLSKNYFNPKY